MASGPETPGLACLMFSIPKRLPTPAPAWEPGAVGRRGRKEALSCRGTGPGPEEARRTGVSCSELGIRGPGLRPPQQGLRHVQLESSRPGAGWVAGNASAAPGAALGESRPCGKELGAREGNQGQAGAGSAGLARRRGRPARSSPRASP